LLFILFCLSALRRIATSLTGHSCHSRSGGHPTVAKRPAALADRNVFA
jgi:hypothetical protein